jgi:hypothetical protein
MSVARDHLQRLSAAWVFICDASAQPGCSSATPQRSFGDHLRRLSAASVIICDA